MRVELNDQRFLESALEWPYVYDVPPFLIDKLHLVRVTAIEKEFDIAIQMTLEHVSSEIQENRNGTKKTFNKG